MFYWLEGCPPSLGSVGEDVGAPQRIHAGPKSGSEVKAKGKSQSQTSKAASELKPKTKVNVRVESRGQTPKSKSHSEPTANATGAIGGMLEICGKLREIAQLFSAIFRKYPTWLKGHWSAPVRTLVELLLRHLTVTFDFDVDPWSWALISTPPLTFGFEFCLWL